jgi:hypothetical protein
MIQGSIFLLNGYVRVNKNLPKRKLVVHNISTLFYNIYENRNETNINAHIHKDTDMQFITEVAVLGKHIDNFS